MQCRSQRLTTTHLILLPQVLPPLSRLWFDIATNIPKAQQRHLCLRQLCNPPLEILQRTPSTCWRLERWIDCMHRKTRFRIPYRQNPTNAKTPNTTSILTRYSSVHQNSPPHPMRNKLAIPQSPHQLPKHLSRALQPKPFLHTRIAKPKTRYTRRHNMECLGYRTTHIRYVLRFCQRIDDALDLYE